MKKQAHVYYTGAVQGVGFRFITEELAKELEVFGWVRNLNGGQVEIVAEADEVVLDEFLNKINQHFKRNITDSDIEISPATGEFRSFEVKF